jgi:hypothetical protein
MDRLRPDVLGWIIVDESNQFNEFGYFWTTLKFKKAHKFQTIKQYVKSKRSETIILQKGFFDCGMDLSLIHNLKTILKCVLHICLQNLWLLDACNCNGIIIKEQILWKLIFSLPQSQNKFLWWVCPITCPRITLPYNQINFNG